MPNKVNVEGDVQVRTKTFLTEKWIPPNIATGAAYAANDAIGGMQEIDVPVSGVIQSANYWDRDDEGLQVDIAICSERFATSIADNAAFSLLDEDTLKVIHVISFSSFTDFINGQMSSVVSIGKAYYAPSGKLYIQAIARGALNIAAGSEPMFQLNILAD